MTMKTNIFVPKKINVGFQNRKDTYTGKLAYVIYYDQKGKLRKETSWNGWRNKDIPNEIYDNEPMEGFVLNKKVGGVEESWGWDVRKTYTRIYDPRGFEFEITVPNLLWILENCDCIKGKGLEGKFVYGWDGTELVLVPVESPDYKEITEKSNIIHNNEFIKAKDLVIGATYETLQGVKYVYMGKYDAYNTEVNYYYKKNSYNNYKNIEGWEHPLDSTWNDDIVCGDEYRRYKHINIGKVFWFIKLGNPDASWSYDKEDHVCYFKNVTRKFSNLVATECEKYPEYYEMLQKSNEFSPVDYSKNIILPTSYEDFYNAFMKRLPIIDTWRKFYIWHYDDTNTRLIETEVYRHYQTGEYGYSEKKKVIKKCLWNGSYEDWETKFIPINTNNLKELYDKFKPMYGEQYLENGKLYLRRGYYGSEE